MPENANNAASQPFTKWLRISAGGLLIAVLVIIGSSAMLQQTKRSGWNPLPTRAPTPTNTPPDAILAELRVALLTGDTEAAENAWETAQQRFPKNGTVLQEGARLALMQNDLTTAQQRAWDAVKVAPKDAGTWVVLGIVEQRSGDYDIAQQALETAEALDPSLASEIFSARWQAAIASHNKDVLTMLAQTYIMEHPQDPLALYFRAEALLAIGYPNAALDLLLIGIEEDSPGVLWYTLGRVYLAKRSAKHAITALEVAAAAQTRGDNSLLLASPDPFHDIKAQLGRAYIDAGRCDKALALLQLMLTPYPDLSPLVDEASRCPQPTPTFTPWLPADWAVSPNER